jgi:hypothetical protein
MKLLSTKNQIGLIVQNMGADILAYKHLFPQWFEDAISIIGIPNYYVIRKEFIQIEGNKGLLPCDMEHLHSVWLANETIAHVGENNNLIPVIIRDNPLIGSQLLGNIGNTIYADIDGRYIYSTVEKAKFLIVFKGMPLDDEDFPMIPDDADFRMALEYYIIYRLGILGYTHPVLDFKTVYQLWEKHYPRAGNSINWMDLQEYQNFTDMWTNPILGDIRKTAYNH